MRLRGCVVHHHWALHGAIQRTAYAGPILTSPPNRSGSAAHIAGGGVGGGEGHARYVLAAQPPPGGSWIGSQALADVPNCDNLSLGAMSNKSRSSPIILPIISQAKLRLLPCLSQTLEPWIANP